MIYNFNFLSKFVIKTLIIIFLSSNNLILYISILVYIIYLKEVILNFIFLNVFLKRIEYIVL